MKGFTAEQCIVYMARVSSPNQRGEDEEGLIKYLLQHQHWSPFDMVDMTVEVITSRAIMAQMLRHWSLRFQEASMRYSEFAAAEAPVEIRMKGDTNRQGSLDVDYTMTRNAQAANDDAVSSYLDLIDSGAAPESARMVLPLATLTRAYAKGSVRSWITYLWQRNDVHAQKEHRELASEINDIFCQEFPIIGEIINKYKPKMTLIE